MGAQRPHGGLFVEFEEINSEYWSFLNYNGQYMKPFYLLFLGFFWSSIAAAQYPSTNYWFAELGVSSPVNNYKSPIKKGNSPIVLWSPKNQTYSNLGGHFESMEGHYVEMFLHGRFVGDNLVDSAVLLGLRLGTGKKRMRGFIEVKYGGQNGNFSSYTIEDEAAGFSYGAGFRYRLTTRMSAQASFLRNHFSQFFQVDSQYKHPARSLVAASLYWNLNVKSDKPTKAPKVKKLSPRRQNRCPYSPSNT